MERVSAGDMADAVADLEHKAVLIVGVGVPSDLADTLNVSVVGRPRPSTTAATGPKFDPAWRMAEKQLAPALESTFGPEWQPSRTTPAPGDAPGEGSKHGTRVLQPRFLEMAFKVKRLNIEELGVGPAGEVVGALALEAVEGSARPSFGCKLRVGAMGHPPRVPSNVWSSMSRGGSHRHLSGGKAAREADRRALDQSIRSVSLQDGGTLDPRSNGVGRLQNSCRACSAQRKSFPARPDRRRPRGTAAIDFLRARSAPAWWAARDQSSA